MSESVKMTTEMEELSRLLDEMNSGQHPESEDQEIAELLEVAALIKKAGAPIRPPQHILDQTLEQVIADMPASRPKRFRTWMYSGTLGTVASILLIISFNLIPREAPSVTPLPTASSEFLNSTQENSVDKKPLIVAATRERMEPADTVSKVTPAVGENNPLSKGIPPLTTAIIPNLPPSEQLKPSNSAKNNPIMGEKAPTVSESKSFYKMSELSPAESENISPVLSALSLPGQTPDSIVIDKESSMIRQEFNKGTPQEIIVTQMFASKDATNTKSLLPAMTDAIEEKPGVVNKVTLIIYDQEVTIEGRQTKQELLKLAESLTP